MSDRGRIDLRAGATPLEPSWSERREAGVEPVRAVPARSSRIALLGHCGTGNLGDEASIAAVLDNIASRVSGASIVGLSMDPEDTTRRHGIPCFAMRQRVFPFEREWSSAQHPGGPQGVASKLKAFIKKTGPLFRVGNAVRRGLILRPAQFIRETAFLLRALLLLCGLDMLVICGGGQLLDWGGPWAFPYTLFKWILLAKCANVKCVFLNSGAGPLDAPLSRWFVRRMLAMADYVSVRDRASGELLRRIGFRGKVRVVVDTVWNLRLPDSARQAPAAAHAEGVIGIGPMAYGDSSRHWVDDDRGYRNLIASLAEFGSRMLARGYRIKLFSSDIWFDSRAIADLEAAIRRNDPALAPDRVTCEAVSGIDGMFAALSGLDCYVTCRFHGVVFASLLNVPAVALAPHPKVTNLMEELGLGEYCVEISRCDAEDLATRVERLLANADDVKARIGRQVAIFQVQLTRQFDDLFLDNNEKEAGKKE
ncbi:polysaccharide pyruvyl transferase family protein [Bosea minatitlanensis]|uniref:Polysaccharide pyruvyl transferase family protein n=1 Tax=Bosea minatitlanensis TaxID=128782 RepID=A0ABW0F9I0_9HYPH|nr:polysaccharide pyruvyl transferase family protein [Bosea minatitlanensis]MCT4495494.1 polysaccharide pyruvyl transferase family protein [Bosea minatitlanensis]